jgi:signal peptidase II
MKKNILFGLIIVIVAILVDQISKLVMLSILQTEGNSIVIIENFFKLYLVFNDGAAFSSFAGQFGLLMGVTVLATIVFIFMASSAKFDLNPFYAWGIYLMIGGMFGNLIDRIFFTDHAVVDFLSFTFWGWEFATFNIADSCLVVGVICVCIDMLICEGLRKKKLEKQGELNE